MLLAYIHCHGSDSDAPDLCLLADKTDNFSHPIRILSLRETNAAVCRIGPEECITVSYAEDDGGLEITPLYPAHIFLTPDLPTFPGTAAKKVKIFQEEDSDDFIVYYITDNDRDTTWKLWIPDREKRQAMQQQQEEEKNKAQ